jgi:hypothetical protein
MSTVITPGVLTPSVAKPATGQSVTFTLTGASAISTTDATFAVTATLVADDGTTYAVNTNLPATKNVKLGVKIQSLKIGANAAAISVDGLSATGSVPTS